MKTGVLVVTVMFAVSVARADKPSAAAGKQAIAAWRKAAVDGRDAKPPSYDAAAKLTMLPLHVVIVGDNPCEATASEAGKLPDAFKCLLDNGPGMIQLKPFNAKALKDQPQLKDHVAEIEKLGKTQLLLMRDENGIDVYEFAVIAVALDGKIAKVTGVFGGVWTR
jgi:hypothetical protein